MTARPAALRDAGMAQAENAADPRVMLAIDAAIDRANASGEAWSCNDIRNQFPVSESGLVGSRVRSASQRRPREMELVGYVPSTLESTHKHPIAKWRGTVKHWFVLGIDDRRPGRLCMKCNRPTSTKGCTEDRGHMWHVTVEGAEVAS